jgi:chitodextrinase
VFRYLGSSFLFIQLVVGLSGCTGGAGTAVERSAVTATPAFVQVRSAVPQTSQTTVTAAFTAAQTAGNLIVAIVGWNDTASTVSSVTDSKGNVYQLAIGPTTQGTSLSQSIYYAKNIAAAAAGANTVSVTFNQAAAFVDLRVLEYSGVDRTAPVDVAVGAAGTNATSSSGSVTTTNATDLLVAGNLVATGTTGAGANYTNRIITNPDGDIAEDRSVTAAGAQTATAPLSSAGGWVMQLVAFKALVMSTDTTPPTAPGSLTATTASSSQINLAWTAATDNTAVTGYLVERCQGASCSNFAQVATTTGLTFNDTGLTSSTSYSYRVRATDAAANLGPYSNTASATTSVFVDTQPPSAPTSLTATPTSSTQINLGWVASTDNVGVTSYIVERCAGMGCSAFAQIGTAMPTTPSFVDTGLPAGSAFSYRVRATDAAGNQSANSNTAMASTPMIDTQPPTAPANLTATASSSSQISLTWTAATDNVGVTGYMIERCQGAGCSSFAQVGTSTTASFGDSGLTSGTNYSYRVRATDAAGNLSPYSNVASATTQVVSTPPTFVQSADQDPQSAQTSVSVPFTAAQPAGDFNVVIVGWTDTTAAITGVTDSAGNTYQLAIGPTALAGRLSQSIYYAANIKAAATNSVTVKFSPAASFPDVRILQYHNVAATSPLDVVAGGTGTNASPTTPAVTTTNGSDLLVAGAVVETGVTGAGTGFTSRMITNPDSDNAEDRVVSATGSYTATAPLNAAGGWVTQMAAFRSASSTPPPPDTTPPTAPGSLVATMFSSSQINLTWTAATDNVGVTGYMIERCQGAGCTNFAQVATGTATAFNDVGLTASTSYSYRVRATDAAANLGPYSNTASATTGAAVDGQPPTAPSGLVATLGGSDQINLTWTAATDNVGVTGYMIERCQGGGCANFAQVATSTATAFNDTGLAASTSFSYRVRATDAAGNLGPYSNVVTAMTGDTQPPTAPASPTATVVSSSQINLMWTAATDNAGVTAYLIERCTGPGCTSFAQVATTANLTFADNGLLAATPYSYRVRATDAAGNLGDYSPIASGTTPAPDTTAPTAPTALNATALSNTQINLTWTAATDDVGVASYHVERCQGASCTTFAEVGTSVSTTFGDTGLASGTLYNYRVRANDAAGNLGPYSTVAGATTQVNSTPPPPPSFVQGAYNTPQTPQTSVSVPFTAAQAAGDLNVVIVGWNDGVSLVNTVTDTAGNSYQLAIGPTVLTGALSQSIYYAANIKAAITNSVIVTFNQGAQFADVRILQYHSIDPSNPLDVAAGGTGTGSTSSTPSVTTTSATDLLVTGNVVQTGVIDAGSGFTIRMNTIPDSDLAADRVVTATGSYLASASLVIAGGWVQQIVAFRGASSGTPPPDATPPVVAVTSPAAGATLSGLVNVSISATDASGVVGVQLVVDGTVVGLADTTPPYQVTFDTTPYVAGSHTIGAIASDTFGNVGHAPPVTVTFQTPTTDQIGSFSGLQSMPLVSVNAALLPNGNVYMHDGQPSFAAINAKVWNPTTNVFTAVPAPSDIFCTGIEQMADGRIMILGGHNGGAHLGMVNINVFDPVTLGWDIEPDMLNPRWYPTATQLHDGHLLVIGGESTCNGCNVAQSETYDPNTDLWTAVPALMAPPTYPHTFELSDGRIFVSSAGRTPMVSQILNAARTAWTPIGTSLDGGSAAEYLPGKFIKTGSSSDPDIPVSPSVATTYVIDMNQPSPAWRQVMSMNFARAYHTLTLLPDGSVLVTGGGPDSASTGVANAVLPAEIWSPDTETWKIVASLHGPRLYHSLALLMPDGRVWISGGGRTVDGAQPTDQLNNEFYSPAYLFKGARPTITSAPATLQYGSQFTVQTPDAANIAKVTLLRFGAVTHTFNTGQRYLPLSFTAGSGALTVTAPANNLAAPGNYLLFIVNTNGVPSLAAVTHL